MFFSYLQKQLINTFKSRKCSGEKVILKNFVKFTGKHLCQSLFLNKVAGLRHRYFPVNFAKFLRTPFFIGTPPVAAF